MTRIADEIWLIAGRTGESERKRSGGNIDDFRCVRGWLSDGYSEGEILAAAKQIISTTGEIRSLWGLLAKAMPDRIAAARGPERVTPDPDGELRVKARFYFARGRKTDDGMTWTLRAPAERTWDGHPTPDSPRFQEAARQIFDEVARELGVTDWLDLGTAGRSEGRAA